MLVGISRLSDGPNERIQAVFNVGVAPRLVELLGSPTPSVQTPALRTVGFVVDLQKCQCVTSLTIAMGSSKEEHSQGSLLDDLECNGWHSGADSSSD